jgi:YegS/Rv2252/BmrU family lipid kinase
MNVVAILNRNAGKGIAASLIPALRVQLGAALADVRLPANAAEATAQVRDAVRGGADVILAAGGDGTLNAVINGMKGSRAALALLPAGSANDFAMQNGCTASPQEVCRAVLRGGRRRIDLIDVNGWRYATDGGIGLCASIAGTALRMRASGATAAARGKLGSSLYPLATVRTLAEHARYGRRMYVEAAGWNGEVSSSLLMINNQRLLGGHFPIAPEARNDDGLFDVTLVDGRDGRCGLLRLVAEVLRGQHTAQPDVHCWQDDVLHIETDSPVPFLGDGELAEATDRFDVRILPAALRLVIPREARTAPYNRRLS